MRSIAFRLFTVAAVVLLAGCATILNKKQQAVNISASNGASFQGTVDGVAFKGPGVVYLNRENANKIITVTTPGCVGETVAQKSVDSKFFINILSGGTFGSTTDYSTKKMWQYADNIVIACK